MSAVPAPAPDPALPSATADLRARLDAVLPMARPVGPAWPTGLPALDRRLGGGVPRGRITQFVGPRSAGKTSLVRDLAARVLAADRWVAVVDAGRTLAPADWAGLGHRLLVVRPPDAERAAWCADRLLRTGLFALVVLDHPPPVGRAVAVRLGRLARDRDAALVVVETTSPSGTPAHPPARPPAAGRRAPSAPRGGGTAGRLVGALRVLVHPGGTVTVGDRPGAVALPYVPPAPRRLRPDPALPDRRGVPVGRGGQDAPHGTPGMPTPGAPGVPGTSETRAPGAATGDPPSATPGSPPGSTPGITPTPVGARRLAPPITLAHRHRRRAGTPPPPFGDGTP